MNEPQTSKADKFRKEFRDSQKKAGEFKDPFVDAQRHLMYGQWASKEKEQFYDQVSADILSDLFKEWIKTEPHEVKSREYLYSCAMALGAINSKLVKYETMGQNSALYLKQKQAEEEAKRKANQ